MGMGAARQVPSGKGVGAPVRQPVVGQPVRQPTTQPGPVQPQPGMGMGKGVGAPAPGGKGMMPTQRPMPGMGKGVGAPAPGGKGMPNPMANQMRQMIEAGQGTAQPTQADLYAQKMMQLSGGQGYGINLSQEQMMERLKQMQQPMPAPGGKGMMPQQPQQPNQQQMMDAFNAFNARQGPGEIQISPSMMNQIMAQHAQQQQMPSPTGLQGIAGLTRRALG